MSERDNEVRVKHDPPRGILNLRSGEAFDGLSRYWPSGDPAPFVEHYWIVRWNLSEPRVVETLPHPSVHMVLESSGSSEIVGLMRKRFSRMLEGRGWVLGTRFRPGGFRPFVGGRMRHIILIFAMTCSCLAIDPGTAGPNQEGTQMTARGTFDVKVTPQPADDPSAGPFGRLFLAKEIHGDLEGTSRGQMMAAETQVEGSGAYVAFEQFTGALRGRRGTFVLQHKGTMRKGSYDMVITVVPDSGTGELTGLAGKMRILIEGKDHSYVLDYTLDGK